MQSIIVNYKNVITAPSTPLDAYETAQSIFPGIARPLQKYLRITRQQPRHTMESILQHLALCIRYGMSPKAFIEKFVVASPVLQVSFSNLNYTKLDQNVNIDAITLIFVAFQNDREHRQVQSWSLICDSLLTRSIKSGCVFQLRQGDVSLLCQVQRLPHFNIAEEIIDAASNKFLLRNSSETPV